MKTIQIFLCSFCMLYAYAGGTGDAVDVDPTHHHVIMENDHVRVFEVLASPGAKSPMHTHPPLVAISLSKARFTMSGPDGNSFVFDLYPGQVIWMENVEHTWELLAGKVHVIAVEVKAAQNGVIPTNIRYSTNDAVAVDPINHNVIMENDYVRVFEVVGSPGAESPMHTHPPLVAVSLNKARTDMWGPDGENFVFDLNPGQVIWMENVEHAWELLAGKLHVIAVEIKSAQ